jgi:hypothetical protein
LTADISAATDLESTALHVAAESGHESTVKLLLEERADISAVNNVGSTALHVAANSGHEFPARLGNDFLMFRCSALTSLLPVCPTFKEVQSCIDYTLRFVIVLAMLHLLDIVFHLSCLCYNVTSGKCYRHAEMHLSRH